MSMIQNHMNALPNCSRSAWYLTLNARLFYAPCVYITIESGHNYFQLYGNFQYKIRKPTKGVGRKYYRQIVIYGGMQRISSFTIRFLGWMI